MINEQSTLNIEQWKMNIKPRTINNDNEHETMNNEKYIQWSMNNNKCSMIKEHRPMNNKQWTKKKEQ